jgi:hypothetical protein
MTANEEQVGGRHYIEKPIQPWDYIIANKLGYLEGNIVKYVSRYKEKGGVEDLVKAAHYLDKLIEVTKNERVSTITNSQTIASGKEAD